MFINLFLGVATMTLCLLLQLALLTRALIYYSRHHTKLEHASFLGTLAILNAVMFLLMFGNLGQVAIWACLFRFVGEFDSYRTAFYHSAVNFATLGYGDIVMSENYRLLGPIQAMNGVLMVGVSTAAFMTTLRDAVQHNTRVWVAKQALKEKKGHPKVPS
ncbi:MAG: ion channel [Congregibacter sp.]